MTTTGPNRATTLVELLVVIAIITVLAGMLGVMVPSVMSSMARSRTKATMHTLAAVLEMYYGDCGQYPDAFNHDPARKTREVPMREPPGASYPTSTGAGSRPLYQVCDEFAGTELVVTLATPCKGWSNPQFLEHFKPGQRSPEGVLIDAWGRRIFYLSAVAYRSSGDVRSGTVAGGAGGGTFVNPGRYQMYSAGDDSETPLDKDNQAGTEKDDIRNW